MTQNSPLAQRLRWQLPSERASLAIGIGGLLIAFFLMRWHGPLPFEELVEQSARIGRGADSVPLAPQQALLFYRLTLALTFGLAGITLMLALGWKRLSESTRAMVWRATWTLACTSALCLYIFKMTGDGPWSPVDVLMSNPGAVPIFGHRLLFVWFADAIHAVHPSLSPLRCYYVSQVVAAFLALYAVGQWTALHVGKALGSLGQVLAVILISSCLTYRNFYDIGVVFFFSCALLALYRRQYVWFVVIVTVATLNHENALLLIPTAAFLLFDSEPRRVWLAVVGSSFVGHVLARAALQHLIPFQTNLRWTLWGNFTRFFLLPRGLAFFVLALGGWYLLGLMSLSACDKRLRRLLLLFPMLLGIDLLVGMVNEPRMFNAFIPVLVAVLLTALQRMVILERGPKLQSAEVSEGPRLKY
jgi:hypothetical protein